MAQVTDETVEALLVRVDEARGSLIEHLRSADPQTRARRPRSGEWSAVENVRHLLFAEQLHLGQFVAEGSKFSELGLTPDFFREMPQFADVGTQPSDDLDEVLAAWDAIHAPTREAVLSAGQDVHEKLEGNLNHLQFHVDIIDKLLA